MKFTVHERDVLIKAECPPRQVLDVRGKIVFYSNGGLRVRSCLKSTFRRWARLADLVRRNPDARP